MNEIPTVLISGGSGMIGQRLTEKLKASGFRPIILSRKIDHLSADTFYWNPDEGIIDHNALKDTRILIHLAGASIAGKRWTEEYKRELADSRIIPTEFLINALKKFPNRIHTVIASCAVGYYGDRADEVLTEESAPGNTFMARLSVQWENAVKGFETDSRRLCILRTGVVFDNNGGFLKTVKTPVKLLGAAPMGNGKQYVSWIDHEDVTGIMLHLIKHNELHGVFNAVAPNPVTNKELMKTLAKFFHRPFINIPIPSILLKTVLGEKSAVILESQRVSAEKILRSGYVFQKTDAAQLAV